MLKVVIDSNVWISGLLKPGNPSAILDLFQENAFELYCANELLADLGDALAKPKLARRLNSDVLEELVLLLVDKATFVELGEYPSVCRDPDDDAFLACAAIGHCDYLITGDPDLLDLGMYEGTKIINPADFLKVFKKDA